VELRKVCRLVQPDADRPRVLVVPLDTNTASQATKTFLSSSQLIHHEPEVVTNNFSVRDGFVVLRRSVDHELEILREDFSILRFGA